MEADTDTDEQDERKQSTSAEIRAEDPDSGQLLKTSSIAVAEQSVLNIALSASEAALAKSWSDDNNNLIVGLGLYTFLSRPAVKFILIGSEVVKNHTKLIIVYLYYSISIFYFVFLARSAKLPTRLYILPSIITVFLARSANLPKGLYILPMFFSIFLMVDSGAPVAQNL